MEMESTNPLTAGRTGSTPDWKTRDTSEESWSIHTIRISSWLRRWATVPGRTKSAEFSARPTAGGPGRKSCTKTMLPLQWISVSSRGNSRVVYATLWHGIRKPGQKGTSYGPGSGLYKSVDEGLTWTQITGHGLPEGDWGRAGVAVAPGNHGQRVYVIVEAKEKKGGLYRSDDAGATWKKATEDKRIEGSWYFGEIYVDPKNADIVYVPSQNLYRSNDGGHTFKAIKGAPGGDDYHSVWIDPPNSQRIMLGVDQGTTISLDGGESWSPWYNQPTGEFYRVATDHRFPYWVYGPQQDSGTAGIASRGNNG